MSEVQNSVVRLLVLTRPRGAWMVGCLPLIGLGYAMWERGSTASARVVLPMLVLLPSSWIMGSAGAMWLNAALDRDRGAVLLGRAVEPPPITAFAGYVALGLSALIAWPLGNWPLFCSLGCALLAILYSHPRIALKGRAIGGPLVNGIGYGVLSPLAGWASIGPLPTWRAGVTLVLIVAWILGLYFAAQAFQADEDRRRGYKTLVATHGSEWTLRVTHALLRVAAIGTLLGAIVGIYPRALLISAPAFVWADRHLSAWRGSPSSDGRRASELVKKLAVAAVLCVLAAYGHHIWRMIEYEPPGGCGTAIVPASLDSVCF